MPHANFWEEARTHRVHHLSSPSMERIRFYCRGSQLALITHSSVMEGWAVFQGGLIPAVWKQKQLSSVNVRGEVSAYGIWRRWGFLEVWLASVSSPELCFQTQTFIVHIPRRTACEEKLPCLSQEASDKTECSRAKFRSKSPPTHKLKMLVRMWRLLFSLRTFFFSFLSL